MYRKAILLVATLASTNVTAELKALEDDVLSGVSGQSGLTLDLESKFRVGELAYFDDGKGIALQGVKMSSAADPAQLAEYRLELDVLNSGDLSLSFKSGNTARFEIEDIRFVDQPGLTPAANDRSVGGLFVDYNIEGSILSYNRGNSRVGTNDVLGGLYDIEFVITDGRLGYRTNGNEFFLDGLTLDVSSLGTVFGVTPAGELNLSMPNLKSELRAEAIRFGGDPSASLGSLWINNDLSSDLFIKAGGAEGVTGMTINAATQINRMDVAWGDDTDWASNGYWVGALGISGSTDLVNLKVDVLDDSDTGANDYGLGLALAFERLAFDLHVEDFVLGETKHNIDAYVLDSTVPIKSIGSFDVSLLFADGAYDSTPLTNKILIQAGGNSNAGYQGLRLDTQLNLVGSSNESYFVYTVADGSPAQRENSLMLSGLEAFVDGDITVDVTAAGELNGETFYDGLRLGFEDVAFGYRIEGMRVAESTGDVEDLKTQKLQSAQRVEGLAGVTGIFGSPAFEGTLNGHVTLGAGGSEGSDGVTINSDINVSNGVMATYLDTDGSGNGIWLSGLDYDVHLRDMMLDVTSDGLKVYETESWSKLDVTDFRIGDNVSGASFGAILESYEKGSETIISAGGAGTVCIGGVGAAEADCTADGGRWDNRGSEGITIKSKRHLAAADGAKVNRFTWHTDREIDSGTGLPDKTTGLKLVFDNYTTNDGNGVSDDFGIQTEYNLDIARAPVLKKSSGPDSNGVDGQKGWEKVMLPDGSYYYKDPALMTAADRSNRPVGIAIRTNTQFKELDFDRVNLSHGANDSTLLYGLKLQNFNVTTDIVATPLD